MRQHSSVSVNERRRRVTITLLLIAEVHGSDLGRSTGSQSLQENARIVPWNTSEQRDSFKTIITRGPWPG